MSNQLRPQGGKQMKVLNKAVRNSEHANSVYIGRGSPWGNRYKIGVHGDREEVIRKFREYAEAVILEYPDWLEPLKGKDLVCFCAPLACHGDVLLEMIGESK
jgi:hypothetical protein